MKQFLKGWWHVVTAVVAGVWVLSSAVLGWAAEVEETYVRKDVLTVELRAIRAELVGINAKLELYMELNNE